MTTPMIPVVDSNMSYVKANVKWLSLEDIHYVTIISKEKGKFEYHTETGVYYSITRVEDLAEALALFNMVVCDRAVIINPEHVTNYNNELKLLQFPTGTATVATSHERKIKSLIS
ncbi:LytTR family transcriptional regulator DNA-binding domain-containing protein [Paenibacillus dokdonensis]|uniref:LytTR family transcriptional regulator DNA-binding domain-containing protein n=1 Tax=Paenibacillus dokdonensis TaxID=2567944 RepID=UPI0010A7F261|nr:LytTR family transcriptional regulator DNA-binding domain-containing protein [Paenibacillus dokdonensis]